MNSLGPENRTPFETGKPQKYQRFQRNNTCFHVIFRFQARFRGLYSSPQKTATRA